MLALYAIDVAILCGFAPCVHHWPQHVVVRPLPAACDNRQTRNVRQSQCARVFLSIVARPLETCTTFTQMVR